MCSRIVMSSEFNEPSIKMRKLSQKINLLNDSEVISTEVNQKIKYEIKNPALNIQIISVKLIENNIHSVKESEDINNNIILINVIQENILDAGTKQRASVLFMEKIIEKEPTIHTVLYSGAWYGFGAIATSYAAFKLDLHAIIFLDMANENYTNIKKSKQILIMKKYGAEINLCNNYRDARNSLYNITDEESSINKNQKITSKKGYYIVPMGFNDDNGLFIEILSNQLSKRLTKSLKMKIKRIWLVVGSGGILMSLYSILDKTTEFFVLLTGGGKYLQQMKNFIKLHRNITVVNSWNINNIVNDYDKYYKSVKNYDAKIFPYVKKYGNQNDYIWNVASD